MRSKFQVRQPWRISFGLRWKNLKATNGGYLLNVPVNWIATVLSDNSLAALDNFSYIGKLQSDIASIDNDAWPFRLPPYERTQSRQNFLLSLNSFNATSIPLAYQR